MQKLLVLYFAIVQILEDAVSLFWEYPDCTCDKCYHSSNYGSIITLGNIFGYELRARCTNDNKYRDTIKVNTDT